MPTLSRKHFELRFGALAPPLIRQITEQGMTASSEAIVLWQKDADALCRVRIRGFIAPAVVARGEKRLARLILQSIERNTPVVSLRTEGR